MYVGERRGKFVHLIQNKPDIDSFKLIFAGKFRRYHNESWIKKLVDVKTNLLNLRDIIYLCIGTVQSVALLIKNRPDVIFIKGGFVGVPVGVAARILRIPFITHDSDTTPGLANRIVGRWARYHATAMPASFYPYKQSLVRHVGIPLSDNFRSVDEKTKAQYRKELTIPHNAKVVLVTGGSQGAQRMNHLVSPVLLDLLRQRSNLYIVHQTGRRGNVSYQEFKERCIVMEFIDDLHKYSAAADVIVCRGSATSLAEFAVQGKPCVVIPAPHLASGHQVKNTQHLEKLGAVLALDEVELAKQSDLLKTTLTSLLDDDTARKRLVDNFRKTTKSNAAKNIAKLLLEFNT